MNEWQHRESDDHPRRELRVRQKRDGTTEHADDA